MSNLKATLSKKIEKEREEVADLLAHYKDKKVGEISLQQIFQGMRGITSVFWETSLLDAETGIRFRGYTIEDIKSKLPKYKNGKEPLPEALFYLMLIGEIPKQEEVDEVMELFRRKNPIPAHVYQTIDAFPEYAHPMTIFSAAIIALQTESVFAEQYEKGIPKTAYWEYVFEDTINLIASLPHIVAYIYRRKYKKGKMIAPDFSLDWSGNFAHMLGYETDVFKDFMRLYLCIHADHEGGNVSAHTARLVASALNDPFLYFASSMNGLAGPLHGRANQEVIKWVLQMEKDLNTDMPSMSQIESYIKKTLSEGRVLPGYGHAVLRKTDPRFTALMNFAKENIRHDNTIQTVWNISEVAPAILKELGKVKNPWPNVDAHSGAIFVHYGMKEFDFYTVLFGLSRSLGVNANIIWERGLGLSIERPKSINLESIKRWVNGELASIM